MLGTTSDASGSIVIPDVGLAGIGAPKHGEVFHAARKRARVGGVPVVREGELAGNFKFPYSMKEVLLVN